MNGKLFSKVGSFVLIAGLLQGYTAALWEHGDCRPAFIPNVKLYQVGDKVLVQYDEAREEHDDIQHRSYFLNENTNTIAEKFVPVFVNPRQFHLTNAIPLFVLKATNSATNSAKMSLYATSLYDDCHPFFLVRDGKQTGPFELPIYSDISKHNSARRAMLTPLAITTDAAVLGGVGVLKLWENNEKDREERREKEAQFPESPKRKK